MNLQRGLVGHYVTPGSIGDTVLHDETGNDYHATGGTVTTDPNGVIDTAVLQDGLDATTNAPAIKDAIEAAMFTVAVWWRQDLHNNAQDWRDLIKWNDGSTKQAVKRLERSNADESPNSDYWCNFGMEPTTTKGSMASSDIGVAGGEWFHLTIIVDGDADSFRILVNAEVDQIGTVDTAEINRPISDIRIGPDDGGAAFEDLRFYNRVLSNGEADALVNQRSAQVMRV
ncbi:hypothetical protein HUG10_20430 (plasmid) [Halorarum halophilum]|uniref:Concanavalin A-like lectin/glucanases superfamily protein n=1 Tax=Halorarum halophilum TaxID=2743090 RepID=A0A7D5KIF3_9EURY|nr:LamG-like jellyroll fold domain-containing protein [Halobaculum halophilum]QLG29976.1 hypothetical protein HUG10_20430 [Halobaculum halophilum]